MHLSLVFGIGTVAVFVLSTCRRVDVSSKLLGDVLGRREAALDVDKTPFACDPVRSPVIRTLVSGKKFKADMDGLQNENDDTIVAESSQRPRGGHTSLQDERWSQSQRT